MYPQPLDKNIYIYIYIVDRLCQRRNGWLDFKRFKDMTKLYLRRLLG